MAKDHGKKYIEALKKVDRMQLYAPRGSGQADQRDIVHQVRRDS